LCFSPKWFQRVPNDNGCTDSLQENFCTPNLLERQPSFTWMLWEEKLPGGFYARVIELRINALD